MAEGIRTVLVDFDHTLSDLGDHVRWAEARPAVQQLYRAAGVPEAFLEEHPGSISLYMSVAALQPLPRPALIEVQRRASRVLAEFEAEAIPSAGALPGAADLVTAVLRLGLRAAVVTSNAAVVVSAILERLRLDGPFEVCIGRDEVARLKPDPEGLLAACSGLEVAPDAAVYVGDSEADIEAAVRAGLLPWGLTTGLGTEAELRAAGAAEVFATLGDAIAALESLVGASARASARER